jgi:hypothetical protein
MIFFITDVSFEKKNHLELNLLKVCLHIYLNVIFAFVFFWNILIKFKQYDDSWN